MELRTNRGRINEADFTHGKARKLAKIYPSSFTFWCNFDITVFELAVIDLYNPFWCNIGSIKKKRPSDKETIPRE